MTESPSVGALTVALHSSLAYGDTRAHKLRSFYVRKKHFGGGASVAFTFYSNIARLQLS
jgi:hypothetical protein